MQSALFVLALMLASAPCVVQGEAPAPAAPDPVLAKQLGADVRGMRKYILVILKTGPRRMADGPERDGLFRDHFANIGRLAKEGKLALAGPFGDKSEWRGMFILAVEGVEEAEALVATDPVIRSGEMIAEYHPLYASAALMSVGAIHEQIAPR